MVALALLRVFLLAFLLAIVTAGRATQVWASRRAQRGIPGLTGRTCSRKGAIACSVPSCAVCNVGRVN